MSAEPLVVVVGDSLLDRDVNGRVERLSPDAPVPVLDEADAAARPGGAALAATLAARDGHPVLLVTALARDSAGLELGALLAQQGVEVVDLGLNGPTPEKIRFRSDGRPLMRLDRGGERAQPGAATDDAREAIAAAASVLVADYGRGLAADAGVRAALADCAQNVPVVWDPHPRGATPLPGMQVVTPNEAEARSFAPDSGAGVRTGLVRAADLATALRAVWGARSVCVTRGADGALLVRGDGAPMAAPAPRSRGGDPCGAGDRFASKLALWLARGAPLEESVTAAVASASAFVSLGGAAAALGGDRAEGAADDDGVDAVERLRAQGGTVVATGGCFDLLHAGHVRTLEAARRLGDCLVVCINSDDSVRRLKGSDRPLVSQEDRASVLSALGCVDAVMVFGEDTPERVLRLVRPHVWAKGGDYDGRPLPEERVLREWGGRAVILPYVEGRSTTRLIEEAACRA